ncbi:nucleolin-like isoform X2 [Iris pallida]|uniref:Nucleolin-like isoform X2 n=1 Tax=Iris pallida TaxID=29817 RepID=A0AAX6EJY0_IRIPA|nr:nucleolin-like isoform X2 [Iris pallida]
MPPRSARKAAAAKKQSPKANKSPPPQVVPPVEDADVTDPAAVAVKTEAEEDSSLPAIVAGDDKEPAAAAKEVATEKVGEETVAGAAEAPPEEVAGGDCNGVDAQEKEMDVDKEVEKQLAEDETREYEVENDYEDVVDKVGNNEGTACVSDNKDESEEEADGEENDEEADDKENEEEAHDKENEEEADDEDDPALYMQTPLTERKTLKHFEIFVGGLDKDAVEEDLIKVFGAFGEIQSVRIVKHPVTQKSKGFAFVHYVSIENARKVLTELKDGTEVKGKQIRISASDDNDTLYLGNICKTWTKNQVIETLKGYGIEEIEDILLPDDPKNEGRIKGFGFLEFASHSDAMVAFHRLRKPDALFGRDISAKISFAQTPLHPSEESLLQVRTVYLEGIPKSWDEGKVEEICKQHGEIVKIQLPKNSSSKRKQIGFVEFSSRDSALACVEGMNNAQIGEGDVTVKARLAKPTSKGRLAKQIARGGYKVKKDGEEAEVVDQSNKKKAKSKVVHDKEETQPNLKSSNGNKPTNSQGKGSKDKKGKMPRSSKGTKRGRQGMDTGTSEQPSKRTRKNQKLGKVHGRPSTGSGNKRRSYSQQTTYAPSYATPAASYTAPAYAGTSRSHYRSSDLEPHAGFLPAAQQVQNPAQVHNPYRYDLRRAGAYDNQLRGSSGYAGGSGTMVGWTQEKEEEAIIGFWHHWVRLLILSTRVMQATRRAIHIRVMEHMVIEDHITEGA